ncbi:DUF362 domain-containing protein [Candidatus Poribacteria bacterium]|nr:DUF362 domain-containing protein [Candidatus Poribacteria bacterium]
MKESKDKNQVTRREFLRDVSAIGLGLAVAPLGFNIKEAQAADNNGKIVVATSESLTDGVSVNATVAKMLLDNAIKSFTGVNNLEEAWKSIFPSLTNSDVVGIKINTLFRLSTHPEVVAAIVQSLTSIGIPENNIIVWDKSDWDMTDSGYTINRSNAGVRYFGTNGDYDNKIYTIGGQSKRLSKILTQMCQHIINVPVLKDHSISGVTFSMKNHYGSVDNPGSLHGNSCDPFIAELNNTEPIKEKTRLIIMDASVGVYVGGPDGWPQFQYNSLMLGQDPVALDYNCLQIINDERKKHGIQPVANAKHIKTAADMGLGTMDPNKIQVTQLNIQAVDSKDKKISTWGKIKL